MTDDQKPAAIVTDAAQPPVWGVDLVEGDIVTLGEPPTRWRVIVTYVSPDGIKAYGLEHAE